VTLRPAIREILERTRLARIALDAQLGVMPRGVAIFMSNENDALAAGLSDEDLTFLKHADGLRGPYQKIQAAKALIQEARAEIRAIVGGQMADDAITIAPAKTKTKTKAKRKTKGDADSVGHMSTEGSQVLSAVRAGLVTSTQIVAKTGLKLHVAKKALQELRERKLLRLEGKGRTAQWLEA
jgi:ribosomal protein S25